MVANLVLTPAGGALADAMAEEGYSETITVSGQAGTVTFSMGTGAPVGLVLDASTGELTAPLGVLAEGNYSFTVTVTDSAAATASADFTLEVLHREVTAANQDFTVPPGSTPTPVELTAGATGGPVDDAQIVAVEPSNAGTVPLGGASVAGISSSYPTGIYLYFTPNPQFTGRAVITPTNC